METNAIDRLLLTLAPRWGFSRIRARMAAEMLARNFEAASSSRRTAGWTRMHTDANAANAPALSTLRAHARDLVRNNSWAKNGLRTIANNTVGWGIRPSPVAKQAATVDKVRELWAAWAETKLCDADGRKTFYALQRQVIRAVAQDGEVLVRRRWRRPEDKLPVPLQLQVLEADFIDTTKDELRTPAGGKVIQGVEFDALNRRVAYYLFEQHPGSHRPGSIASKRIPASEILHIFHEERPGQVRGVSWFAPAIVKLKDFDEYEDATLLRQKIAACLAAFVEDPDGLGGPLVGEAEGDDTLEELQPGTISYLEPGKKVTFASPPVVTEGGFTERSLRYVAKGIGVTYEDLTGDYSESNYSNSRMAKITHWGNVHEWRWDTLIPLFCDDAFAWFAEAAEFAGHISERPRTTWTPPPMPMLEPDKEAIAAMRLVRAGAKTHDEMVREQGYEPEAFWKEYKAGLDRLDKYNIKLDSDVRAVSQAGLTQERAGAKQAPTKTSGESENDEEP